MATKNIVNYEILCSFSIIGNYPVLGRCRLFTECEDVFGLWKILTVHDVINAIEKKGEFYFTYNLNQINVNRKVSIKVENKTINQILDQLFSKSGIDYKIENRHIVLYKQAASEVEAVKQQKSINGIVADEQGEPIIGASVLEKGTTNGTITDLDGRFTLSIGKGTELIVSYVGYTTKTVKIGNQSTIKIVLIEDTKTLDEVVVIGYGTQKKY